MNSDWIPVTEHLPKEGQAVLVYLENNRAQIGFIVQRHGEATWVDTQYGTVLFTPTHWQPLPLPPDPPDPFEVFWKELCATHRYDSTFYGNERIARVIWDAALAAPRLDARSQQP